MGRHTVVLILYLAVFVLAAVFGKVDINVAQTHSDAKSDAWESDSLNEIHAVRGVIYEWIDAWQGENLDGYMSYYSPEFRSAKLDYNGWRLKKAKLFKRPGAISVQISKLLIFIEGNEARASFLQEYADAYISDVGKKNIELVKFNGTWKIVSEEWKTVNKKP